jgi:hypothetical protein
MDPDLLSIICREIDERLNELRPLLAEQQRLLAAADVLVAADTQGTAVVTKRPAAKDGRRGGEAGAARRRPAAAVVRRTAGRPNRPDPVQKDGKDPTTRPEVAEVKLTKEATRAPANPVRAMRGAAREAILGALEHGSHTVGELVVVTAMGGSNISGNLRRLAAEGVVVKAEREGKAAWMLSDPLG